MVASVLRLDTGAAVNVTTSQAVTFVVKTTNYHGGVKRNLNVLATFVVKTTETKFKLNNLVARYELLLYKATNNRNIEQ